MTASVLLNLFVFRSSQCLSEIAEVLLSGVQISESCDNVWADIIFFHQETEFCQLRIDRCHPSDERNLDLDVHYN